MSGEVVLKWSSQLRALQGERGTVSGDRIILPASSLEALLAAAPLEEDAPSSSSLTATFNPYNPDSFAAEQHARNLVSSRHKTLPYPLTFRIVNPQNNRLVYGGVKEFSAPEGSVVLSDFILNALDLHRHIDRNNDSEDHDTEALITTIHAQQLPRGTFVKLRPLEPGYDPEDWKALLEQHLRKHYTTLTRGEILTVPAPSSTGSSPREDFQFLIDELLPQGESVCIIDTDLEVDIEALTEDQARETLRRIVSKRKHDRGQDSSVRGGTLDLFQPRDGAAGQGEYVEYELPSWDKTRGIEIELSELSRNRLLYLFASPFSPQQQDSPRVNSHVVGNFAPRFPKRIRLMPSDTGMQQADTVRVSVHAPTLTGEEKAGEPVHFSIRAYACDAIEHPIAGADSDIPATHLGEDEVSCPNCARAVPKSSLVLHESFCRRNNVLCPKGCGTLFRRGSELATTHWHCSQDEAFGDTESTREEHNQIFHEPQSCPSCSREYSNVPSLARHRTTLCPGKLILCKFCHLVVAQGGDGSPNAEVILSGLTPHEIEDGGRTTECHLCQRIVRLRDMDSHMKRHDMERTTRPIPRVCRNTNCGNTVDGASKNGSTRVLPDRDRRHEEPLLCKICFGSVYISTHDPDGRALKRRIERKYLTQLLTGCGKSWCRNPYCKTGRSHTDLGNNSIPTKDALPLVKPFLDGLMSHDSPLHFCVDEGSQRRRRTADMLSMQGATTHAPTDFSLPWSVAGVEAEDGDLDRAVLWLRNFAPSATGSR